jgi:hypothetical protein
MRNAIIFTLWVFVCGYLLQTRDDYNKLDRIIKTHETIPLKTYQKQEIERLTWLARYLHKNEKP